ncbi:MAG: bifunctional nuclease family protein [Acidimicrobiales bacterium]|nr:bifunctional nuclease family protein [Acidimicrobiales bacterium]
MVEVELVEVRVEMPGNTPIVLLRERGGTRRLLPILIGDAEARAIVYAVDRIQTPRPMTHDLFRDVLETLGVGVRQIVVTELRDRTFFAELHLVEGENASVVSARPSDAIALAVRTGCPIFVSDAVLDEAGYVEEEKEPATAEAPPDEVIAQFKDFLESVNPEDFRS